MEFIDDDLHENFEVEVRFLDIDKPKLIEKVLSLGGKLIEDFILAEIIFFDRELHFKSAEKFVRLRSFGETKNTISYKHHRPTKELKEQTIEYETSVGDVDVMRKILENIGLVPFRRQEKRRISYEFENTILDIDTWPNVAPYLEIEGKNENDIQNAAIKLGFDWKKAEHRTPKTIIEEVYNIPVSKLKYFTFSKIA